MAPDYDHLTLMQKVEVFEHAVNNTAGDDLAKLLWLKSPSSEVQPSEAISGALCKYLNMPCLKTCVSWCATSPELYLCYKGFEF